MDATQRRPTAVVADDHPITAAALATAVSAVVAVVAVVERGDAVLKAVVDLQPSLVLLDLMMPGVNGLDLIEELIAISPVTRVIVVSGHGSVFVAAESLARGATAFFAKAAQRAELLTGVSAALMGETFVSWSAFDGKAEPALPAMVGSLSHRQQEILRLIGEDLTSEEIATRLGISPRTVHHHRTELRRRLEVESDWDLRRLAHTARFLERPY